MVSTLHSKLIARLFERLDDQHLTVLDIGPATPETVNFFSRYRCRLYFADLLAEPLPQFENDGTDEGQLEEHFTKQLNLPPGAKLDICLFWDFLNYLDNQSLPAFGAALRPYLHKDTRSHGFGVINSRTQLENLQYGVQSEDTLSGRHRQEPQLPYYPHPQITLNEALTCLQISKGVLMSDGRLEILLTSTI